MAVRNSIRMGCGSAAETTPGLAWLAAGSILAISCAATVQAYAQAPSQEPATVSSLLAAEDRLFAADVHHDLAAIDRGFADEAIFVHANGDVQTKADYLKAAAHGGPPISSIITEDRVARVFGDVGVVRGVKKLVVGDLHLSGTYLTVYVMRDGRWQMLDEQSSPAPGPRPPR